ncbi:serine hydrolase domain-containing protein [Pseudomonas ovata]|uniref:serine hydrolase domain-containing protein n=1 Tax=Pseudomonas ovata TaxID=1839709 RepID=UPI0013797531|nr:serine hydrolase domain-containing protein [Pseudomonas ovata]
MLMREAQALQRLDRCWREHIDSGKIVGGVLLLAHEGEVRYASARGWADREASLAMARDTRFRLASLTKLLTSVVALRLCELGILGLPQQVSDWLADFRPRLSHGREASITLRQLLSHTSGLSYGFEQAPGNAYQQAGVSDGLDDSPLTLEDNLQRLAHVPLRFEPGSAWGYSLATDVLGAVIEKASGLSLAQAIARWVTAPLQMAATGFVDDPERPLAKPYKDAPGAPQPIADYDNLWLDSGLAHLSARRAHRPQAWASGGAGLLGTADDYLRLLECLRQGGAPLLESVSTAALLGNALGELPMASRGPGWGFGLGPAVLTDPVAAQQVQGRGTWGWCGLYGCHYWVDPQAGLSLVVMTNTAVAGAWGALADGIVSAVYSGPGLVYSVNESIAPQAVEMDKSMGH